MSIDNLRYLPVSSGTVTLIAGAAAIIDVEIRATSLILLSLNTVGGAVTVAPYVLSFANLGAFNATANVRAGVGDTSTYNWVIFNPRS
jgi:hypothetical protein